MGTAHVRSRTVGAPCRTKAHRPALSATSTSAQRASTSPELLIRFPYSPSIHVTTLPLRLGGGGSASWVYSCRDNGNQGPPSQLLVALAASRPPQGSIVRLAEFPSPREPQDRGASPRLPHGALPWKDSLLTLRERQDDAKGTPLSRGRAVCPFWWLKTWEVRRPGEGQEDHSSLVLKPPLTPPLHRTTSARCVPWFVL